MKKLTCKSPLSEFNQRARELIISKQRQFTFRDLVNELIEMCDETVMIVLIETTILLEVEDLLKNGLISWVEDDVYQNNIFNKEESIESTL